MTIELELSDNPTPAESSTIIGGLVAHNDEHGSVAHHHELAVLARCDGTLVAGLLGHTNWNWLFIRQLWVAETLRGVGTGGRLLAAAESEAIARGCAHAHCDTFGFQALPFYQKLGYEVFGRLEDYPPGHTRFFLQKRRLTTKH